MELVWEALFRDLEFCTIMYCGGREMIFFDQKERNNFTFKDTDKSRNQLEAFIDLIHFCA